jgi:hypothetical protein
LSHFLYFFFPCLAFLWSRADAICTILLPVRFAPYFDSPDIVSMLFSVASLAALALPSQISPSAPAQNMSAAYES